MQKQNEKSSFDFLTKIETVQEKPSFSLQIVKYMVSNITAKRLALSLILITGCWTFSNVPYYIHQSSMNNQAKEERIEAEKNAQSIAVIKSMTPEDLNNVLKYIQQSKAKQSLKLTTLYWKIKYLNETQPEKYPMSNYVRDISKINKEMTHHFNQRYVEVSLAYKAVMAGNKYYDNTTYDNANAYEKLIYWKNAMDTAAIISYEPIDKYLVQWDEDFLDQAGIQTYLNEHKDLIANTKIFSID